MVVEKLFFVRWDLWATWYDGCSEIFCDSMENSPCSFVDVMMSILRGACTCMHCCTAVSIHYVHCPVTRSLRQAYRRLVSYPCSCTLYVILISYPITLSNFFTLIYLAEIGLFVCVGYILKVVWVICHLSASSLFPPLRFCCKTQLETLAVSRSHLLAYSVLDCTYLLLCPSLDHAHIDHIVWRLRQGGPCSDALWWMTSPVAVLLKALRMQRYLSWQLTAVPVGV